MHPNVDKANTARMCTNAGMVSTVHDCPHVWTVLASWTIVGNASMLTIVDSVRIGYIVDSVRIAHRVYNA